MRSRPLVLGALVVSSTLTRTGAATADGQPPQIAGTFQFAGDPREETARKVAIDRAIDSLFFAIRPIARSRLSNGSKIDPSITIAFEGGKIRVRTPGAPDALSPDNGAPVDYVTDGERSKLSQRMMNGRLVQAFIADEGRRTNELTLSPDGNTLVARVVIASSKLSVPVVYALTYKRTK